MLRACTNDSSLQSRDCRIISREEFSCYKPTSPPPPFRGEHLFCSSYYVQLSSTRVPAFDFSENADPQQREGVAGNEIFGNQFLTFEQV